jgi:AcrR family transcriptional regulator
MGSDPREGNRRLSRQARIDQILDAAIGVVAADGFVGATTDAVARAAGISQAYVVRMFDGKAGLLTAVFARAAARVVQALETVPPGPDADRAMRLAYINLTRDRNVLLVVLHGLAAGADPTIGAQGRRVLADVARLYRDRTGCDVEAARRFVANLMLVNTLLAINAWEHLDDDMDLAELARSADAHDDGFAPSFPA